MVIYVWVLWCVAFRGKGGKRERGVSFVEVQEKRERGNARESRVFWCFEREEAVEREEPEKKKKRSRAALEVFFFFFFLSLSLSLSSFLSRRALRSIILTSAVISS